MTSTSSGYAEVPTAGLKKKAKVEEAIVKLNGKKLRAGTVPWRCRPEGSSDLELFLIEGLNSPGFWTFPAGSLDPGEEVSLCAMRETHEECGAKGALGCFLGVFEEKNRTYLFSMQVTHVEDENQETWHDPHSAYEGSGARRRGWFSPDRARSVLKKDGPKMLDAFLAVPSHRRIEKWRACIPKAQLRIFILGGDDDLHASLQGYCSQAGELLQATSAIRSSAHTAAQRFAVVSAALWEADVMIGVGAGVSHVVAMAAAVGCSTLLLVNAAETLPMLLEADSRVTLRFVVEGSADVERHVTSFLEKVKGLRHE